MRNSNVNHPDTVVKYAFKLLDTLKDLDGYIIKIKKKDNIKKYANSNKESYEKALENLEKGRKSIELGVGYLLGKKD